MSYVAVFFAAQRFLWAAAILARVAALNGLRLRRGCSVTLSETVIHFGGRPRRLPWLDAMRSSTSIASAIWSRSARSSASMLTRSIEN